MRLASSTARAARASIAILLLGLASGCATTRSPSAVDYSAPPPDVVAEYQSDTRTVGDHGTHTDSIRWKLWREGALQVREYPDNRIADHWQLDGATLFHTRYFHAEGRGVEFQQEDLGLIGARPEWQQIALLVSPTLLAALPVKSSGQKGSVPWVRYKGMRDGTHWDVTVRTDLMLPMRVTRKAQGVEERLILQSAVPLMQSDWKPEPVAGYDVLDFTDLGDNERDPFVLRVQNQLGLSRGHAH